MNSKNKLTKKAGFASFVLPRKPSNKVGISITRSQSAKEPHMDHIIISEVTNDLAISRRPLSFDRKRNKMPGNNTLGITVSKNMFDLNSCLLVHFTWKMCAQK